jgi:hypothetical protein
MNVRIIVKPTRTGRCGEGSEIDIAKISKKVKGEFGQSETISYPELKSEMRNLKVGFPLAGNAESIRCYAPL